jgi:hypothetical protein
MLNQKTFHTPVTTPDEADDENVYIPQFTEEDKDEFFERKTGYQAGW